MSVQKSLYTPTTHRHHHPPPPPTQTFLHEGEVLGVSNSVCKLLSNSNPTWNSTELELVRVGVDFVFQCHNKNKKKNPHLILIYRKGLQVYNLGRVTVWVSRSCLEGVWKVSGRCLEIVWKVSGRCLEGV